jgi:hypothetical protein
MQYLFAYTGTSTVMSPTIAEYALYLNMICYVIYKFTK